MYGTSIENRNERGHMKKILKYENDISLKYYLSGEKVYTKASSITSAKLPFVIFIACNRGSFNITFLQNTHFCKEGDVVIVPIYTEYSLNVDEGSHVLYACANLFMYSNLNLFSLYDMPAVISDEDGREMCRLIEGIVNMDKAREFTSMNIEYSLIIKESVFHISSLAIKHSTLIESKIGIAEKYEKLSPAFLYISDHLVEIIKHEELYRVMKMSSDSFYRFFKSLTKMAPRDFIVTEKLNLARVLLVTSDMTIQEISDISGYDNQHSFAVFFKSKFGITPKKYKGATENLI